MNKIFGKSPGQIMIVYAVAVAGLLAAAALGTDVAVMYVNWQHAQKVADAAALAGANYLQTNGGNNAYNGTVTTGCNGDDSTDAGKAACTYAVNNGLPAATVTISEPTSSTIKVVATQSSLPYYFGSVMGTATYSVSAAALANSPGPTTSCNGCPLIPLGLQCTAPCPAGALVAGEPVSFGTKFVSSVINLAGNWGWLDLTGTGGKTLQTDLSNGASGTYSVGQTVWTDTGAKTGPVNSGMNSRTSQCPTIADPCSGGNPSDIPAGDPCLVVVPVVDFATASKNGTTALTIESFAEVYLDPSTTTGTSINGCYVSTIVGNTVSSSGGTSKGPQAAPTLIQ
jgi:hypothetical protein